MARKSFYLPKDDLGRSAWLNAFAVGLQDNFAALGLTQPDVDAVLADAKFFAYTLKAQTTVTAHANAWTTYKNGMRDGGDGTTNDLPVLGDLSVPPALVAPGIITRTTTLVARIKLATGYTEAIGQALGVIGTAPSTDVNTLQPELTVWLDAGKVKVGWFKQGMDGLEIWVDRGSGFGYLAINTVPDYTDATPLPSAGQSALWKYKAVYRKADKQVGQWSNIVSIAVAG